MGDEEQARRGESDSLRGTGNDIKGKVKDAAGGLTGDTTLQAEGKWDQVKGKAQKAMGDARQKLAGDESDGKRD